MSLERKLAAVFAAAFGFALLTVVFAGCNQGEEDWQASAAQLAAQTGDQRVLAGMIAVSAVIGLVLIGGGLLARHHLVRRMRAESERDRLFENSLDLLCLAGADGYFKRVNPAFTATLGWSAGELLSRPLIEFIHPDDREVTRQEIERQLSGQSVLYFSNRYVCKDGTYRVLAWKATAPMDGIIYAAARDVTELRAAQEQLRQSEEDLRVTLRSIGDGVLATDTEGRITRLNPVAEKLTGWSEADAKGWPVAEVFHIIDEETRQPAVIPVERVLATGLVVGLANHTALIARDGAERPIADSAAPIRDREGRVLGVVLVFRDVTEERKAEARVEQAREYAENIVQTVPEPLVILDPELRIRSANRAFYLMFNVERQATEGCLLEQWDQRQWDLPELRERLKRVLSESASFDGFEMEAFFPALGRRNMQLSARKIFRPGNNTRLILLAIEDISARKQLEIVRADINETLEKRVKERTEQLEAVARQLRLSDFSVENASVGIVWIDLEGRIMRVNRACIEMLGYPEAELLQLRFPDLNLDLPPGGWAAIRQELRDKKHLVAKCRLRRKDGHFLPVEITRNWLNFDGQEYIVSFVRDITERQQTEEQLQSAKAFSDELINSVPGLFFCFTPEGRFLRWNHMIETLLEYSSEEIARMTPLEFVAPEDCARATQKIRETFERGHSETELTLVSRSGRQVPFQLSSRVVLVDGQPALLGTGLDLTERKNVERQMLRSQRMESIGSLAGGIAHDLNNALAPVMMGLSLLRERAAPEDLSMLDMMEASARRGADMVRQVLTFGKGVEGRRLSVQIRHLLAEMGKIVQSTFPKNILLQTKVPRQIDTVLGDPTQLHQVLLNLCVNARDAMPDGGTLTLEAGNVTVDEAFVSTAEGAKVGRYVVCRVSDTGTGIPPEILERIFEPFYTTKGPEKGTGLGLSTAMGIVRSHGGFLQVQSRLGQGSTFCVYVPSERPQGDTERVSKPDVEFRGSGETVLVVDDEVPVRTVTSKLLQKLNFKVLVAADGTEALVRAAEHRADLRLVITDQHMPCMDGLTFARALKHMVPEVSLIVMSGRFDAGLEEEFRKLGMVGSLAKPFALEQLVEMLQKTFVSDDTTL